MHSGLLRACGWLATAAVACCALGMALLHLLAPEVSPARDMVDAYLATPYALLSRSTFAGLGIALAALAVGLMFALGPRGAAAVMPLDLASLGFFGVALFPEAADRIGLVTRPLTLLAILVASLVLHRRPRWEPVGPLLVALALLLLGAFALTFGVLVERGLGGAANRAVLAVVYAWCLLVARGLLAPEPAAPAPQ